MSTALANYNKKMKAIHDKINEIKHQNKSDLEKIEPLRNEYTEAINRFDLEKADGIAAEIDRIERVSALKEEQVKMLESKDHPEVKKIREEYSAALQAESERLIADYTPLREEVLKKKEEYMELAAKAFAIENDYHLLHRVKHFFENPNSYQILPIGFPDSVEAHAISANQIRQKGTEIGLIPPVELVKRRKS